MDLWIRSQNKERLRLPSNLRIYQEVGQTDFNIQDDGCILGTYKTKERALEVLDEIQEAQLGNYHYRCPSNVKVSNENMIVYEMPKE